MSLEMVYIQINWIDIGKPLPEPVAETERNCIWFMVDESKIIHKEVKIFQVIHPRYVHNQDVLFGSIQFTPMQTDGEFYITPYKNNIDIELDMVGLDEAFGSGDDVETLGAIALERRNAEYASVERWYFSAIALYDVHVFTYHTEDGNDSETEYELLGILDTSKLKLALATKETT